MTPATPRAYLLMRTDLPSLGDGKSRAHAFHAGNALTWKLCVEPLMSGRPIAPDVEAWHREGAGFGTAIAIGSAGQVDIDTMEKVVEAAGRLGLRAGLVVDESYPYLVDAEIMPLIAETVHTLPPDRVRGGWRCYRRETTAAWLFGMKGELDVLLARFDLTPDRSDARNG